MTKFTLFAVAVFFALKSAAQCPVPGPLDAGFIQFTDQEQIDDFATQFPNCTSFPEPVRFSGDDITSLAGLAQIQSFEKSVRFQYMDRLENFHGLENVAAIGGELRLDDCSRFKNFDGFAALETIEELYVSFCDSLESLHGLEKIDSVAGNLEFHSCHRIENFEGLGGMKKIGGSLWVDQLNSLKSLSGIGPVERIDATLGFFSCPIFADLSALSSLETVRQITISDLDALENLSGLENVKRISSNGFGRLSIKECEKITDLSGLKNADLSDLDGLFLLISPALSGCAQPNICEYLKNGGLAAIDSNLVGCNSVAEVLAACDLLSATEKVGEKSAFFISPNPLGAGDFLKIEIENDFFGIVKFEILSLDGRVLHTFWEEKTARRLNVGRVQNPSDVAGSAFFIRVSDGKRSATRQVIKL
jgi:hypothetical protein